MDHVADALIDENGFAKFRCPECSRGLRVPDNVIGRKIGCPFCKTLFKTSFALEVDAASVEGQSNKPDLEEIPSGPTSHSLTRYLPSKAKLTSAVGMVAQTAKSGAEFGVQSAQNAASAVASTAQNAAAAVSSTAKKAAAAATPLTQVVTGFASVLLPGTGEVIAGKTTQGFCTMAAFIGAAGVATAGGAWIAAPIAIGVYSAMRGVQAGRELGQRMKDGIEASDTDALESIAEDVRNCTGSTTDEKIQRELLETEAEELSKTSNTRQKRIVLTRIRTSSTH